MRTGLQLSISTEVSGSRGGEVSNSQLDSLHTGNKDNIADNDGDSLDSNEYEAVIAEARAEGDRASTAKAKHALASRYSLEKKLVKLSTRKGEKITPTIWQFGHFQQVSCVDDWQRRGR
jgi:hypothetical protein